MEVTRQQLIALKRKQGELGITKGTLAKEIGVSRRTLYNIWLGQSNVHPTTFKKLNDWIIDQYTTLK